MPRIVLILLSLLTALVLASCAVNSTPTAGFTVDATVGTTDHLFAFDAATSSDPDGGTLVYAWDFGDGATAAGEAVDHGYAEPGSFEVALTVTDADGASDTVVTALTVSHGFAGMQGVAAEMATTAEALMAQVAADPAVLALAAYPNLAPALSWSLINSAAEIGGGATPLPIDALAPILTMVGVEQTLPRGEFAWDPLNSEWTLLDDSSDDLIVRWPFAIESAHIAELILDWNASAETVVVDDGMGGTVEVPVAMQADLSIDGEAAGTLLIGFAWYDGAPCAGAILEPALVTLFGEIGLDTSLGMVAEFTVDDGATTDTLASTGLVVVESTTDALTLGWEVTATGTLHRDDTCLAIDTTVEAIDVSIGIGRGLPDEMTDSVALAATLTGIDPMLGTVVVENGTIAVDDIATMTFEGTLADADMDGVPDIDLTDADGDTQTLAEFLAAILVEEIGSLLGR